MSPDFSPSAQTDCVAQSLIPEPVDLQQEVSSCGSALFGLHSQQTSSIANRGNRSTRGLSKGVVFICFYLSFYETMVAALEGAMITICFLHDTIHGFCLYDSEAICLHI